MLHKITLFFANLATVVLVVGLAHGAMAGSATVEEMLADRVLGDADAPITIVEYSSLTCPHCADFHTNTLPKLKADYLDTGKAKLVYRDFPLGNDGRSIIAAMLARCAPPDRYFGFLVVLFRSQRNWALASDPFTALSQSGQLGGIAAEDFEACMKNEELFNGIVKAKADAAAEVGIESTPTFIINGQRRIEGSQPYETFEAVLQDLAP